MATRTATVRDWKDAITIGPVRLHLRAAGNLIGWRIDGAAAALTPGQRVELAVVFAQRVTRTGTVWEAYAELFPPTVGGLRRGGPRDGVVYVDYE